MSGGEESGGERDDALGALAGGLAHELNNLLSTVVMMVDLLAGSCPTERDRSILAAVEESARRGVGLVRQLLWIARGVEEEGALFQPRYLLLDLQKMAQAIVPDGIRVTGSFPPDLWLLRGSPFLAYRAVLDLCLEARHRLSAGGELALAAWNVELDEVAAAQRSGLAAGRFVVFEVAYGGTASELPARAASLVAALGGAGEAFRRPGGGQELRLFLPAVQEPEEKAAVAASEAAPARGALVLVAERDELVRETLVRVLERHGYRTLAAADGAEAVALFAQCSADVGAVVVGTDLRYLDGPGVLRAIHRLRADAPVLATGTVDELARWPEGTAPPRAVLAKPFGARTLLAVLGQALAPDPG